MNEFKLKFAVYKAAVLDDAFASMSKTLFVKKLTKSLPPKRTYKVQQSYGSLSEWL